MDKIIIDTEKCSLKHLMGCMQSKDLKLLDWRQLSDILKIPQSLVLSKEYRRDDKALLECVLAIWKETKNDAANINVLVDILIRLERPLLAENIKMRFHGDEYPQTVPGTKIRYTTKQLSNSSPQGTNIFKGHYCEESQQAAVKRLKCSERTISIPTVEKWNERAFRSLNVVELFGWGYDIGNQHLYLALELAEGTLVERISSHKQRITNDIIVRFLQDAVFGLEWLHVNKITHGNIKPENILIFKYRSDEIAKLSDFGLARSKEGFSLKNDQCAAPEELNAVANIMPTEQMDIYSLGVVYFYAMSKCSVYPFPKESRKIRKLFGGHSAQVGNNLINWMLQQDHHCRPSVKQIINHPMFWAEEKCLKFLGDISRTASDQTDVKWKDIASKIDESYSKYFSHRHSCEFSWKCRVDERLYRHKNDKDDTSTSNRAKYDAGSLMSLVKLIRDKEQHFQDMEPGVVRDLFSYEEAGSGFSRKKYTEYFLTTFPDILIILFCLLSTFGDDNVSLDTIRTEYLKDYLNLRFAECWTDEHISNILLRLAKINL